MDVNLTPEQKEAIFYAVNFVGLFHPLMRNLPDMKKIDELHDIFMPDKIREEFKGFFEEKEPEQVIPIKRRRTFSGGCRVIQLSERRVAMR